MSLRGLLYRLPITKGEDCELLRGRPSHRLRNREDPRYLTVVHDVRLGAEHPGQHGQGHRAAGLRYEDVHLLLIRGGNNPQLHPGQGSGVGPGGGLDRLFHRRLSQLHDYDEDHVGLRLRQDSAGLLRGDDQGGEPQDTERVKRWHGQRHRAGSGLG